MPRDRRAGGGGSVGSGGGRFSLPDISNGNGVGQDDDRKRRDSSGSDVGQDDSRKRRDSVGSARTQRDSAGGANRGRDPFGSPVAPQMYGNFRHRNRQATAVKATGAAAAAFS